MLDQRFGLGGSRTPIMSGSRTEGYSTIVCPACTYGMMNGLPYWDPQKDRTSAGQFITLVPLELGFVVRQQIKNLHFNAFLKGKGRGN